MQQPKRKNSHLGLIVIFATLVVLTLILIASTGIFFFTHRFNAARPAVQSLTVVRSPLSVIDVTQVDPALALAALGGVSEADVIIEAINKVRPETALASLLFQPTLPDKESAGDFLLLATAYLKKGDRAKGIFSYQMAGLITALSPDLPDTVRADVLLQVSEGLLGGNEPALAKFYLDQAFILAAKSPFLQAAHRRAVLERLQKNYIILGERELARQSLNLSANPLASTSVGEETTILPGNEAVSLPASGQEAEANRWERAQELAALLVERGGNAPQSAKDALREALLKEDEQKLPFYENELATTTQLSKKIDVAMAQIAWLSIKYRVAKRGYGLSLVPEWEADAEQIRARLTKSYETFFALYADLIVALPEVSQIDRATSERLRHEILAGELGRYPNYPEEQRRKQLLDVTNQLMKTQSGTHIFVGIRNVADQEIYTLISPQ